MKFSSQLQDTTAIEIFTQLVAATSRLSKKRCCVKIDKDSLNFVSCASLQEMGGWFSMSMPNSSKLFRKFDMVGMNPRKEELNFIYFELDIDCLARILTGKHCYLKLKLSKNKSDEPLLAVDVRSAETEVVTNEIPVTIVLSKYWQSYARPSIGHKKMSISMPPAKSIARFVHSFKSMRAKVMRITASSSGDLRIATNIDEGEIDVSFSDLGVNREESDSQEETSNVQLMIKNVYPLFQSFAHSKARVKMNIITNRMVEFIFFNEDFNLTYIIGNIND